jgi:hypothetical protein
MDVAVHLGNNTKKIQLKDYLCAMKQKLGQDGRQSAENCNPANRFKMAFRV